MDVNSANVTSSLFMDDFQKCCRLCLTQTEPLLSIIENANIPLELSTCLCIEVTDQDLLPKNICSHCINQLHSFYNFYVHSKASERWLLEKANDKLTDGVDNRQILKSPCESEFFPEFLDSSNNSFDMELLANDSNAFNALEYLTEEHQSSGSVPNKLVNSGIKVTKVTNIKGNNTNPPDDSYEIHMEIDVLDSDLDIVNELLSKQSRSSPPPEFYHNNIGKESYSCMSCKIIFNDFEKLAYHMGSCEALKRTCVDCGKLFGSKEEMLKHRAVHNTVQRFTCHCGKQFVGFDRLNQHTEKCHSDFVARSGCVYKCKECGDIFQYKDELYIHAKSHIKLKEKMNASKFACEECGAGYLNKTTLLTHQKTKHGGNQFLSNSSFEFKCKVCSKVFAQKSRLYAHIKQHTNLLDNTEHLCDSCGKSFNSYKLLSTHVLTHVGNKYECSICRRQFINGSLLKKHLSCHEIETQVCEVCGLTFSNDVLLNIHHDEHLSN